MGCNLRVNPRYFDDPGQFFLEVRVQRFGQVPIARAGNGAGAGR